MEAVGVHIGIEDGEYCHSRMVGVFPGCVELTKKDIVVEEMPREVSIKMNQNREEMLIRSIFTFRHAFLLCAWLPFACLFYRMGIVTEWDKYRRNNFMDALAMILRDGSTEG